MGVDAGAEHGDRLALELGFDEELDGDAGSDPFGKKIRQVGGPQGKEGHERQGGSPQTVLTKEAAHGFKTYSETRRSRMVRSNSETGLASNRW